MLQIRGTKRISERTDWSLLTTPTTQQKRKRTSRGGCSLIECKASTSADHKDTTMPKGDSSSDGNMIRPGVETLQGQMSLIRGWKGDREDHRIAEAGSIRLDWSYADLHNTTGYETGKMTYEYDRMHNISQRLTRKRLNDECIHGDIIVTKRA